MSSLTSHRVIVALKEPIEVDGVEVQALHLRRAKVRDRLMAEKAGKSDAEKEIAMIAALADLPPEAIHDLDMSDYGAVQEVLRGFF